MIDLKRAIGLNGGPAAETNGLHADDCRDPRRELTRLVNLQLAANGLPTVDVGAGTDANGTGTGVGAGAGLLAEGLLANYREKTRLLQDYRCPADRRIEEFLNRHTTDLDLSEPLRLPGQTLVLDRHGLARELSLPATADEYVGPLVSSYRIRNGVLHNPRSDRRTTAGTFHVAEGGLPEPFDKKAVPKRVFAELFRRAMRPPEDVLRLPFHGGANGQGGAKPQAAAFVSLLLRPVVCPEVPGVCPVKTMETRFFAPGSLVSNLDFVESIFGNAGDPYLPENDAALDVEHWTGHTGCVVLAPHLVEVTKKDLGLPHESRATERQKRDGMCWKNESEKYNDGKAFKITCRTEAGVIVTLIADNYFGYCKKEVKTQLSYAANLYGNVEEEHAGGAVAFPSYNLGDEFQADSQRLNGRTFADVARDYAQWVDVRPEGYGVDKVRPELVYVPEDAFFSLAAHRITWKGAGGKEQSIPLLAGKVYMTPSGYKVRMERHPGAPSWRLVGTVGDGTLCHKPCTVSGGGKSEISKSITDYMLYGPIFVADIGKDLDKVDEIFKRDYSRRWRPDNPDKPSYAAEASRPILSPKRSLGSVIKLLTPSHEYTDEYNRWLASIPSHVYPLVFIIKRFQRPEWSADPVNADWRKWFGVDIVNGYPGNELKYGTRKLVGTYLRVGLLGERDWRTFKLRQDFYAAAKVQAEDDITASVVVPGKQLGGGGLRPTQPPELSYKFVVNCEYRLFQRPDDAVHRGLDKQTEADLSGPDNFISNFEPLRRADAQALVERAAEFDRFTAPMQRLLRDAAEDGRDGGRGRPNFVVSSAHPRLVDGKPTKNPRYLQLRPDLARPLDRYVAELGLRLFRAVPADQPVHLPVDAVLMGRRNNPPDAAAGIRALAVYNPIHYQELPELFMDFVCSLTGKSPSTTGAGSEGALTKGPFNAVRAAADLNNAFVSYVLTGLGGFSTAAGHIGPNVRVDHDISLLVPEIWCRLSPREREPAYLIGEGYLEAVKDFEHNGEAIHASRLGYRITDAFVRAFFGRVFDNPGKVFDEAILRPETQGLDVFADGVRNICEAQQRVARQYFQDGSVRELCPPLQVLMSILAFGSHDGMTAHHPEVRAMFTRESVLASDWYRKRLETKQRRDVALWQRHRDYLAAFLARPTYADEAERLGIGRRLQLAEAELERVSAPAYLRDLVGALGAHPFS